MFTSDWIENILGAGVHELVVARHGHVEVRHQQVWRELSLGYCVSQQGLLKSDRIVRLGAGLGLGAQTGSDRNAVSILTVVDIGTAVDLQVSPGVAGVRSELEETWYSETRPRQ